MGARGINALPAPPAAIGWRRRDDMSEADGAMLARWLESHARAWLFMEYTGENDGTATERWLDVHAYRGRQEWFGTQRLVEYLLPGDEQGTAGGPLVFTGDAQRAELRSYRVSPGKSPGLWLVDLGWATPPEPNLRFSVQALAADGSLRAQVDRTPGRLEAGGAPVDRVGVAAPQDAARLILKVYEAATGAVLSPAQTPTADHMVIADLD
jgi:hypothetical protein